MKKTKILLFVAFLSVCCSLLATSGDAQASDAEILKKWTRINAFECIVDNKLLHSPIEMRDSNGNVKKTEVLQSATSYATDWILTPSYGFGGTTPGSSVPCTRVLGYKKGYNGMTSLLSYGGMSNLAGIKWNNPTPSDVDKLLTSLDYIGEETEDGGGRFSIQAHRTTKNCKYILWDEVCDTTDSEASTVGITVTRQNDGLLHYERDSGNFWQDLKVSFADHNLILELKGSLTAGCTGGGKLEEPLQNDLNTMYSNLSSRLTNLTWTMTCSNESSVTTYSYTFGVSDKVVDSSEISQYVIKDQPEGVANKVNRNLTGSAYRTFTSTEKYILYDYYLNKAIAAGGAAANRKTCNPTSTTNLQPVKLLDTSDNKFKTCYVNLGNLDANSTKVNAPNDEHTKIVEISIADVIKRLDNLDTSSIDIGAITGVNSPDDPYNPLPGSGGDNDVDGGDDGVYPCIEAAESLGWVLCPVLDFLGRTINGVYGAVEDSFLIVDVGMLSGDTHTAWEQFRNYANIIFIIVFLIVILSQITGFGVSNYGVKKILPRLIALAVLVNVSFIICQLAVEVSNIVGASIKDLLSNLSSVHLDDDISAGGIVTEILSVLGLAGAAYGTATVAPAIAAVIGAALSKETIALWLIMILVTFIGFLIGILFAGILLAARQAGVILLVVLSPVAIVCYALPNTKPIFDKWRRIFMSLLLVYPMCGAVVGGGQFATALLINNNGGFFYTLIAMLLSIVPFFFIPSLVRTALNSIGQLGARISNFGRNMSGGLNRLIRGSERFKDAQRELAVQRDEAAVRWLDARARQRGGLTASGRRRRLRAYMRADKNRREDLLGEFNEDKPLLINDLGRQDQIRESLAAKDFDERVAGAKANYRRNTEMAHEDGITAAHDDLIRRFGDDPNNIQLHSQLRALQEMDMEKGAPGEDLMEQSIARWITENNERRSWNDSKRLALSKLSAGLATRYGKELNKGDKGFNAFLGDFAKNDFSKLSSFRKFTGKDGKDIYLSDYDTKVSSFSPAGFEDATPGALQRGMEALRAGYFTSSDPERAKKLKTDERTLLGNLTKAFNDERISNEFKTAETGYMQEILGYGASDASYDISQYSNDDPAIQKKYDIFTSMEQGTLDNLSQFITNADATRDLAALRQLGANIQASAMSGHTYSESDTKKIRTMLSILSGKTHETYEFNPSSIRVDQNGQDSQQNMPDAWKVSDADRAKLAADAAKRGNDWKIR